MADKRIYDSFLHFVEVHKIHQHEIDSCFGKDYFKKNPLYANDRCINKLAKHMEMNIKVRTVYPTNSSVQFVVIDNVIQNPNTCTEEKSESSTDSL